MKCYLRRLALQLKLMLSNTDSSLDLKRMVEWAASCISWSAQPHPWPRYFKRHFDAYLRGDEFPLPAPARFAAE
jgi:hypothetical protein